MQCSICSRVELSGCVATSGMSGGMAITGGVEVKGVAASGKLSGGVATSSGVGVKLSGGVATSGVTLSGGVATGSCREPSRGVAAHWRD